MWLTLALLVGIAACVPSDDRYGQWGWISGTNAPNAPSSYVTTGDLRRYDPANSPGARAKPAYVRYLTPPFFFSLYAYGGYGYDTSGTLGLLNDMIAYDPVLGQWAHMSGNNPLSGTADVPPAISPLEPGGRMGASLTHNGFGTELFLFGGASTSGGAACSSPDYFSCAPLLYNTLMKFLIGTGAWSYEAGSVTPNDASNPALPTPRAGAASWYAPAAITWGTLIFGGWGFQAGGGGGPWALNDLWLYVGGTMYNTGHGGTVPSLGTAWDTYDSGNVPGSRYDCSTYWNPATNTNFVYGGTYMPGIHWSDLWEYDSSLGPAIPPSMFYREGQWRQRSPAAPSPTPGIPGFPGLSPYPTSYPVGVYGPLQPPERFFAPVAINPSGTSLYMFGGMQGSFASPTYFGGFWQFDLGTNLWRRLEGDVSPGPALYGPLGVHGDTYHPGGEVGIAGFLSDPDGASPDEFYVFFGYRNPYTNDDWSYLVPPFLCYGVPPTSAVCSGHGECLAEDTCDCVDGSSGADCSVSYDCAGIPSWNTSYVCSGHGECVGHDDCLCDLGYTEQFCDAWICDGLLDTDPGVCAGHGVCESYENCVCDAGYYTDLGCVGISCGCYDCYGESFVSAGVCGGHGSCSFPDNCDCDSGWGFTDDCSWTYCFGVNSTLPEVCSGHGTCTSFDTCDCDVGYTGPQCNEFACDGIPSTSPTVCGGHGTCTSFDTCDCDTGYLGPWCQQWECDGVAGDSMSACNSNGICVGPDQCVCYSGYTGAFCDDWGCPGFPCQAADDCALVGRTEEGTCFAHGECVGPNTCICRAEEDPDVYSFWQFRQNEEFHHCEVCRPKTPTLYWDEKPRDEIVADVWRGRKNWWYPTGTGNGDDLFATPPASTVFGPFTPSFRNLGQGITTVMSGTGIDEVLELYAYDRAEWSVGWFLEGTDFSWQTTGDAFSWQADVFVSFSADFQHKLSFGISHNPTLSFVRGLAEFEIESPAACTIYGYRFWDVEVDPAAVPYGNLKGEMSHSLRNIWAVSTSERTDAGGQRIRTYFNGELVGDCDLPSASVFIAGQGLDTMRLSFVILPQGVALGSVQFSYLFVGNRTYTVGEVADAWSAYEEDWNDNFPDGRLPMLFAPYTCYDKGCDDECVCSGNGFCLWQDHCECFENYIGDECETLDLKGCFGIDETDESVCSGHGDCVDHDTCVCELGWNGTVCEQYIACDRDCGAHGYCIEDVEFWLYGYERCDCEQGWSGRWCQQYINCNLTYTPDEQCFHWLPVVAYPLREGLGETVTSVYYRDLATPPLPPDIDNLGVGPQGVFINTPPIGGGVFDIVMITNTPGQVFGISFWVSGVAPNLPDAHFTFGGSIGVGTDVRYTNDLTTGFRVTVGGVDYSAPWVIPGSPSPVSIIVSGVVGQPQVGVYIDGLLATPLGTPGTPILVAGGIIAITDIQGVYRVSNVAYWRIPFEASSVVALHAAGPLAHIFDALFTVGTSPMCHGLRCDDPSVCSGRGVCAANDVCECCPGFQGELGMCEEFAESCPVCLNCSLDCGDHGQCATRPDYEEVCDCDCDGECDSQGDWGGEWCDIPYCPDGCDQGTCVPGGCLCDEGWFTKNCSLRECENGTIFDEELWACREPVCYGLRASQTGVCGWRYVRPCPECGTGCVGGFSRGRCVDDDVCLCYCGWKGEDCSEEMCHAELMECMPES